MAGTIQPSKTYFMAADGHIKNTKIDGAEAYVQSVWKSIHSERYSTPIYTGQYGFETRDLFQESPAFVKSVIKNRVKECLQPDDRFIDIVNFEIVDFSEIGSNFVEGVRYLNGTWYLDGTYALDGKGEAKKFYFNDRTTVAFRALILSIYGKLDLLSYSSFA